MQTGSAAHSRQLRYSQGVRSHLRIPIVLVSLTALVASALVGIAASAPPAGADTSPAGWVGSLVMHDYQHSRQSSDVGFQTTDLERTSTLVTTGVAPDGEALAPGKLTVVGALKHHSFTDFPCTVDDNEVYGSSVPPDFNGGVELDTGLELFFGPGTGSPPFYSLSANFFQYSPPFATNVAEAVLFISGQATHVQSGAPLVCPDQNSTGPVSLEVVDVRSVSDLVSQVTTTTAAHGVLRSGQAATSCSTPASRAAGAPDSSCAGQELTWNLVHVGGDDRDGDGIADTPDQCDDTPFGAVIGTNGCHDKDGDGVPGDGPGGEDHCLDTPISQPVDIHGCSDNQNNNHERTYVALGDSFSSGEGAYSYLPNTDIRNVNHCHRSVESYPFVANTLLDRTNQSYGSMRSVACSGAQTQNVLDLDGADEAGVTWENFFCGSGCDSDRSGSAEYAQIDQLKLLPGQLGVDHVDLVTIGIGGNDGGFSSILQGCLIGGNCVEKFDPSVGGTPAGVSVAKIGQRIKVVLERVHLAAPQARIVLVGYPVFIDKNYSRCPAGIGANEAEWIRGGILDLNFELWRQAVLADRLGSWDVDYLSLEDAYGTTKAGAHVHCSGNTSDGHDWFHELELNAPGGGTCLGAVGGFVCNESFHPRARGQIASGEALAACIEDRGQCKAASQEVVRPASRLIDNPDHIRIVTGQFGNAKVGRAYSEVPLAIGGQRPYKWKKLHLALNNGNLPKGLRLSKTDGSISGIPKQKGKFYFELEVKDAKKGKLKSSNTRDFSITVS